MKYIISFFVICFVAWPSSGQTNQEVIIEVQTPSIDRNLISKLAINQASKKFVQGFLGEKKYQQSKTKIETEIIPNNNRYILYVKTGSSVRQEDQTYLTSVTIGLSQDNLQTLLVQNHLFYDSLATSCVLPVVIFTTAMPDKQKYIWWKQGTLNSQNKTSVSENLASYFYSELNKKLIENSFYSIDPMFSRLYATTPKSLLPKSNKSGQFINLSDFLSCHIVLSGDLYVYHDKKRKSYVAEITLSTFNIKTKQKLFDFSKTLLLKVKSNAKNPTLEVQKVLHKKLANIFDSILFQLSFYKDRGSLHLQRTMISVQGPLNHYEKEQFKNFLINNISSIKGLQERLLASNKVIYEAEISDSLYKTVKELNKKQSSLFQWQIVGYNKQQINIYVKSKN